jgi:hypothetical protein
VLWKTTQGQFAGGLAPPLERISKLGVKHQLRDDTQDPYLDWYEIPEAEVDDVNDSDISDFSEDQDNKE